MTRKKTAEQKLKEFLAKKNASKCLHCSYYKNGYCNDLDTHVDPDFPVCSDENYYS